jgi:hypothetical protein
MEDRTKQIVTVSLISVASYRLTLFLLQQKRDRSRMGQDPEEAWTLYDIFARFGLAIVSGAGLAVGGLLVAWIGGKKIAEKIKQDV